MTPDQIHAIFALGLGFAIAGLLATGYQAATERPVSFRLLDRGPGAAAFAAMPLLRLGPPFLAFAAPFIIMRNIIRGRSLTTGRFQVALLATIVAGFWSLMSGNVAVM